MKFFFFSWFNILLVFVPLSAAAHYGNWDAKFRFSFSFLAIIPLAKLLGDATEQLSVKLGPTLGGLLNASFGNAVEIIVGIAALLQGELRIVQTSMLGSILSNLLLVLGMSFFAGGLIHHRSTFRVTAAQTSSSLMTLACITLVIPAAYQTSKAEHKEPFSGIFIRSKPGEPPNPDDGSLSGLLIISRGTSILLLIVYASYLYFQLKSHADLFETSPTEEDDEERNGHNHHHHEDEEEEQKMNSVSAALSLLTVTVITSFCADFLVASIEETAEIYHIPRPFIGLILIPLVANAAEHVTGVWMAMKNKMMLAISISLGSSIQIATFVVPLLVIVGWIVGKDLTLFFADFETIVLFASVLLVNILIMDGESNYMEGLMCIVLYLVIGLAFWVS
jgi:Ca2+:H+ antiporter